jgi:hypothetical protein
MDDFCRRLHGLIFDRIRPQAYALWLYAVAVYTALMSFDKAQVYIFRGFEGNVAELLEFFFWRGLKAILLNQHSNEQGNFSLCEPLSWAGMSTISKWEPGVTF